MSGIKCIPDHLRADRFLSDTKVEGKPDMLIVLEKGEGEGVLFAYAYPHNKHFCSPDAEMTYYPPTEREPGDFWCMNDSLGVPWADQTDGNGLREMFCRAKREARIPFEVSVALHRAITMELDARKRGVGQVPQ